MRIAILDYGRLIILFTIASLISAIPTPLKMPTTINANAPLLSILQQAYPTICSYKTHGNIVQANAEGFRIEVEHRSSKEEKNGTVGNRDDDTTSPPQPLDQTNDENRPQHLFVKRVQASSYPHKPWSDLRRTLLYARTEARFYTEFLPLLQSPTPPSTEDNGSERIIAPRCHFAAYNLDGLVGEDEPTDAPIVAAGTVIDGQDPSYDPSSTTVLDGRGGVLVLDALRCGPSGGSDGGGYDYVQASPVTLGQAEECLMAVARLHAAAFEDGELLGRAGERLCRHGGAYNLMNRNPGELIGMEGSWETFMAGVCLIVC